MGSSREIAELLARLFYLAKNGHNIQWDDRLVDKVSRFSTNYTGQLTIEIVQLRTVDVAITGVAENGMIRKTEADVVSCSLMVSQHVFLMIARAANLWSHNHRTCMIPSPCPARETYVLTTFMKTNPVLLRLATVGAWWLLTLWVLRWLHQDVGTITQMGTVELRDHSKGLLL